MSEQTIALTLICVALGWLAYWAAQVTVEYRAARDARWDAEDAEVFGPRAKWGQLDASDVAADTLARQARAMESDEFRAHVAQAFDQAMAGRPNLAALRAQQEARVLDDDAAVESWLSDWSTGGAA